MLTKEEILEKNYKAYEKRIAYSETVFAAMDEYANQNKWISVKDRLPEDRTNEGWSNSLDVNILYEDSVVSTGSYRYLNIEEWVDYLYNKRDKKITHWQKLPNLPKQ